MNSTFTSLAKHTRISPRKARLVAKSVRTNDPEKALVSLSFMPHKSARLIADVIKTAISDAKNQSAKPEDLVIKSILIEEGIKFKRFRARSKGMAAPYTRRTSHIRVTLEQKAPIKVEKSKTPKVQPEIDKALASAAPEKPKKVVKSKNTNQKVIKS